MNSFEAEYNNYTCHTLNTITYYKLIQQVTYTIILILYKDK